MKVGGSSRRREGAFTEFTPALSVRIRSAGVHDPPGLAVPPRDAGRAGGKSRRTDRPPERAARDARLGPIGGGSDEIMREILGRVLGL